MARRKEGKDKSKKRKGERVRKRERQRERRREREGEKEKKSNSKGKREKRMMKIQIFLYGELTRTHTYLPFILKGRKHRLWTCFAIKSGTETEVAEPVEVTDCSLLTEEGAVDISNRNKAINPSAAIGSFPRFFVDQHTTEPSLFPVKRMFLVSS